MALTTIRRPMAGAGLPAVLLALLLAACEPAAEAEVEGAPPERAIPVTVAEVQPASIELVSDYAGRARGAREVEVRSRVSGILEERLYVEGQLVERGEALFRIDPEPFELAHRRAVAARDSARAELALAASDAERYDQLFGRNAVSERERDVARSRLALAEAALADAEAGIAQAQLDLDYTRVEAPIAGSTGLETLPEGSLVERGSLLTTVTLLDPIHVRFALPETDALAQQLARRGMAGADDGAARPATLVLPDGSDYAEPGEVDFTDATIDPRTGTVSARAIFANPDQRVVPGQFVRVRIAVGRLDDVYLIDPTAVGEGPDGPQVFVVGPEERAEARPVVLGPVVDGRQVVEAGLEPGERLVVNGQVALRDGALVEARPADAAVSGRDAATAADGGGAS